MKENNDFRKHVGIQIRKFRNLRGLTMEQLVEAIGDQNISVSTLQRLEKGQTRLNTELLKAVAGVLDLELYDLIGREDLSFDVDQYVKNKDEDPKYTEYVNDKQKLFYPDLRCKDFLNWQHYPIRTLAEFIIYLPLMDPARLADVLFRIAGDTFEREDYLLQEVAYLYEGIPDTKAKRYADYQAAKMRLSELIKGCYNTYTEDEVEEMLSDEMLDRYDAYQKITWDHFLSFKSEEERALCTALEQHDDETIKRLMGEVAVEN